MLTYDRNTLSESALGLLGISATTGLSDALVSSNKKSEDENKQNALLQEKEGLAAALMVLESKIAAPPSSAELIPLEREKSINKVKQELIDKELDDLKREGEPKESKSFWEDILSDINGVTLHRFQMVVWTVVLSIIFLRDVYVNVAMPEFSGTLLALMGISGGTYIGFKFPEKSVK